MGGLNTLLDNSGTFLNSVERTADLYDRFANRGALQKRQAMQDQMTALQLTDAVATSQHRAALRPYEVEQAQAQQQERLWQERQREAQRWSVFNKGNTLLANNKDLPPALRQQYAEAWNAIAGPMIDNDKTGKRVSDFRRSPVGNGHVMMLDAPQPDGSVKQAPLGLERKAGEDARVIPPEYFLVADEAHTDEMAQRWGVPREQVPALAAQYNSAMGQALELATGKKPEKKIGPMTTALGLVGQYELNDDGTPGEFKKYGEAPDPLKREKALADIEESKARAERYRSGDKGGGKGSAPTNVQKLATYLKQTFPGVTDQQAATMALAHYNGDGKLPAQVRRLAMEYRIKQGEFNDDNGKFDPSKLDAVMGPTGGALTPPPVQPDPKAAKVTAHWSGKAGSKDLYERFRSQFNLAKNDPALQEKLRLRAMEMGLLK